MRAFSVIQVVNIVMHALFTLLLHIGLGIFIGWLATERWGAPDWAYVPLILLGVGSGFYSMIRFVLDASRSVERLEREREERRRDGNPRG